KQAEQLCCATSAQMSTPRLGLNSSRATLNAASIEGIALPSMNHPLRNSLLSLVSLLFAITSLAHLQATGEEQASRQRVAKLSTVQLASHEIERRVDELLRQMTLEEKIGKLVQYSATEEASTKPAGAGTAALNVNPPGPNGVDSFKLAAEGRLGS